MTTHVFLDIDGVFNAYAWNAAGKQPDSQWPSDPVTGYVAPDGGLRGYRFTWFTEVIDWINKTSARDDVQFHWLTTWRHWAPTQVAPVVGILDSEQWPVLDKDDNFHPDEPWWKHTALKEHVEEQCDGCRFVWIDDDLYDSRAREWARSYVESGKALLVQPSPHYGLTPVVIEAINDFLDKEAA